MYASHVVHYKYVGILIPVRRLIALSTTGNHLRPVWGRCASGGLALKPSVRNVVAFPSWALRTHHQDMNNDCYQVQRGTMKLFEILAMSSVFFFVVRVNKT